MENVMRLTSLLAFAIAMGAALADNATAQTSSGTTAGQSTAGTSTAGSSTTGSALSTQTVPAPQNVNAPINPAPGTTPQLLTGSPAQRTARTRSRRPVRTSNSYQNGTSGTVQSNDVVNGTAATTPPPLAASSDSNSATNGQ
jgi:hypothetical protein